MYSKRRSEAHGRDKRAMMVEQELEEMVKRSLDEVVQQASEHATQKRSLENLFREVREAVDQF